MKTCRLSSIVLVATMSAGGLNGADEALLASKVGDYEGFQALISSEVNRLELVRCLIAQLEVVPLELIARDDFENHARDMRTIWSLRALRRLTGLDFVSDLCGDVVLPADSAWFTGEDDPFFRVWMSRDTIYLAPACVQQAIIDQWKAWIETPGQVVPESAALTIDDWYF